VRLLDKIQVFIDRQGRLESVRYDADIEIEVIQTGPSTYLIREVLHAPI
jgi:hypothetical protein